MTREDPNTRRRQRRVECQLRGFTLVEMLIAMAVTLILMAALAKSLAYVGESIRDSRGEVQLSTELRDITSRMRSELEGMTTTFEPSSQGEDQRGYFVYYEGPVTDCTSSLFGAELDQGGSVIRPHSRYGDFDDYIAFTAVATGDSWFTGKVPRFLLDQKQAEVRAQRNAEVSGNPGPNPNADPYDRTLFPEDPWEPVMIRSKYAEIIYYASPEYDPTTLPANPRYVDTDGRYDLGSGVRQENGLPDRLRLHRRVLLIRPDLNLTNGTLRSMGWDRNYNNVEFMLADSWPTAGATVRNEANENLGWLYGMAAVHQQCDLSVRRVWNANGLPTQEVAANSLEDLAKPHNRFAHVRVPGFVVGLSANTVTSMPVLALGSPATILSVPDEGGNGRISPPPTSAETNSPIVTPTFLSGFLRPEFVLGNDLTHFDSIDDVWGLERIGEDVVTNKLLGFDVKIYDPDAAMVTTSGGLVVDSNDAGYRETMLNYSASPDPDRLTDGHFVDLAYPVLAGSSLRGWGAQRLDRLQNAATQPTPSGLGQLRALLRTPYSGVLDSGNTVQSIYHPSFIRSGKILTSGSVIRLFQPTYDTFTSAYETDGFLHGSQRPGSLIPANLVGGAGYGTRWASPSTNSNYVARVDLGSNGLDDDGYFGADDIGEWETLPPFSTPAMAIKVTVRLEDQNTRQVEQSSLVHRK